jgi:hypothetical protein
MLVYSLIFLCMLLFFPETAMQGSKYGATLWLQELLPTLLPFFIALQLFRCCLPKAASHPAFLLLGLLCGYPSGATLVAAQYNSGCLTRSKAYFYLGFVNNPSPMFILAFCGSGILHMTGAKNLLFFALITLAGLIGSLLFQPVFHLFSKGDGFCPPAFQKSDSAKWVKKSSLSKQLDAIILDSFVLTAKIGGYVILFSIFGQFLRLVVSPSSISGILCLGSMEITSGVSYLKLSLLPLATKKVLTAALLAFGGLSAAAQTGSVLSSSGLSIFPYILNKLVNALVACLICLLLNRFL